MQKIQKPTQNSRNFRKNEKNPGPFAGKNGNGKKSGPRQARTAPEFKSGFGLLQLPQAGDVTHRQGEHQGLSGALDARLGHDVAGQNKERNSQQQELCHAAVHVGRDDRQGGTAEEQGENGRTY